jgi:pimeloyl-ACP methyl ester carboxylesterase
MTLTVGGARIHLVDEGTGVPTLFLHGNPDSSEIWAGVIARLRPRYRCLAPDLPAFGHSTAPPDFDCSLEGLARFVDDLTVAIGLTEPMNLVVHDFGGIFGLLWAIRHPEKVRRIAAMNTGIFSDYHWHFWARVWRTPVLGELSQLLTSRWAFTRELKRGSSKLTRSQMDRTYDLVSPATKKMILRLYRAMDPQNFKGWDNRLLEVTAKIPTLVLWGDQDPYIEPRFAERFGAQQVVHFPDCGHWVQAEAPDRVADQLLAFLG